MIIDAEEAATRGLVQRLRDDAQRTLLQAEVYERDARALNERALRKRNQAEIWRDAARKLETLIADELQERDSARKEGKEDAHSETN